MFTIENKYKKANIPTTVRFTESVWDRLKAFSAEHEISFNELVLRCCDYALDNYGEETEDSPEK